MLPPRSLCLERSVSQDYFTRKADEMTRRKLALSGYVLAAGVSFLLSVGLWFSGSKEQGAFVGLWVPSILAFGALMMSGGRHE